MDKKRLLILCALLVLVIIGASVLYNGLSGKVETAGLAAKPGVQTEATETTAGVQDTAVTEAVTPEEEPTATETEVPDYSAPDFTVLDWDGQERKLSDFFGKPIVLNFWASWCGPCKSEMPEFEEAYKQYGEDIHFLMVNVTSGDSMEDAKAFIEENGYNFPVYFDTTGEAGYLYGTSSIPMTFFIDAEGNLVTYGVGALTAEWLQKGIDYIYTEE